MAYQPIENYGIVGNMRTVALIGTHGSVDWFFYPHFDSPSLFGAILDSTVGRSGAKQAILLAEHEYSHNPLPEQRRSR